jgi:hypothetical protein
VHRVTGPAGGERGTENRMRGLPHVVNAIAPKKPAQLASEKAETLSVMSEAKCRKKTKAYHMDEQSSVCHGNAIATANCPFFC